MAMKSTQDLFKEFFEQESTMNYLEAIRPHADRPEVYAYEEKLGKQIFEMNVDELFDMLATFRGADGRPIDFQLYRRISQVYRSLYDYYSDHYQLIRNPWKDNAMRGMAAQKRVSVFQEPLTWPKVEKVISDLYQNMETSRAEYIECMMRMFYDGFADAREILSLHEGDIDFKRKMARLPGRTVKLEDRTLEMMRKVHTMPKMTGWREYDMVSWHDSYITIPVRNADSGAFQKRDEVKSAASIYRILSQWLKQGMNVDINYQKLYRLGFYDFMVKVYGLEHTNEILLSVRDEKASEDIDSAARMYGITDIPSWEIKKNLGEFIRH